MSGWSDRGGGWPRLVQPAHLTCNVRARHAAPSVSVQPGQPSQCCVRISTGQVGTGAPEPLRAAEGNIYTTTGFRDRRSSQTCVFSAFSYLFFVTYSHDMANEGTRVAIVTGAGSGFGAGIAKRFQKDGVAVIVADIVGPHSGTPR